MCIRDRHCTQAYGAGKQESLIGSQESSGKGMAVAISVATERVWQHTCAPIWHARHALLALQDKYPALRRQLGRPWDSIRTWQLESPPKHR
eukprot:3559360-Karenia_brevis.AAC.1